MVGNLIMRGLIVGIVAGILAFGWAKTFGEPSVDIAIAFESAQGEKERAADIAAGKQPEAEEPEIFSRGTQSTIGLFTGVVGVGAGIGAIFAVLFAFSYGRIGNLGARATSLLLSFYGLVSVYVIPAIKYPPNPPSVGEADTIKLRTAVYFLMMGLSVASLFVALIARRSLVPKLGSWNASVIAVGVYVALIAAWMVALPAFNEVPAAFPAVVLWNFRIASLAIQIILWIGTGLLFGYAAQGLLASHNRSPLAAGR